ncbi:MAG: transcriptional regulator [Gammaproteobacteria bacterium RIFCSPHIGHO2_12_FULL_41_20]|nr:MAG: transcriptional regulator [Gammaproteobacteria bacterium RIFCSPHIGHO2_12_FULL_41_20]
MPAIPDKRYFSISEASVLCGVKPYVLRYWEQEFSQIKPNKRQGNRRFYLQEDILLIRQIRKLLYEDGFTIEGARAQLMVQPEIESTIKIDAVVKKIVADLEIILQNLKRTETAVN